MIAMYDLEDNLINVFDNYKECAKYFNTTSAVIRCYICRKNKKILDKKRDKKSKKWCRLFRIEATDDVY